MVFARDFRAIAFLSKHPGDSMPSGIGYGGSSIVIEQSWQHTSLSHGYFRRRLEGNSMTIARGQLPGGRH
jgi:hypothetical protein